MLKTTQAWLTAAALAGGFACSSALAQAPPPSPQDFAEAAAASDTFEILEGQTALAQSRDQEVRRFAEEMVADHMRIRDALDRAAQKSGIHPPHGVDADQARLLSSLQSERGAEFDRDYVIQQIAAHQAALAVQTDYAAHGSDPNLRQAAASAAALIRHHLEMAQQLRGRGQGR